MISRTTSMPLASLALSCVRRAYLEHHHVVVLLVHHLGAGDDGGRLACARRAVEEQVRQVLLLDVLLDRADDVRVRD